MSQGSLQPSAFTPSAWNGWMASAGSALDAAPHLTHQLCCVSLLLTGKTGASPGVRTLKANIILHFKWQSRVSSLPCQNHSGVTSPTLILFSLRAGEPGWVMDDDWRMLPSLVKHLGCVLLFSSLVLWEALVWNTVAPQGGMWVRLDEFAYWISGQGGNCTVHPAVRGAFNTALHNRLICKARKHGIE